MLDNPIRRFRYPPERLISKLGVGSNDVVIDFGCGPGFFLIPLAKVAGKAIGVDVSPGMLERAARKAKKKHRTVKLLQSDGTDIRLADESVDMILLNHVFHEVENKSKVLGEFRRILRPSGTLAIVERTHDTSSFWRITGPPVIDEKEFAGEIEKGGFILTRTIAYGDSSIMMSQKAKPLA
jgi:ubiquinone/menaquinone biosynthesis C-methylase UbiE